MRVGRVAALRPTTPPPRRHATTVGRCMQVAPRGPAVTAATRALAPMGSCKPILSAVLPKQGWPSARYGCPALRACPAAAQYGSSRAKAARPAQTSATVRRATRCSVYPAAMFPQTPPVYRTARRGLAVRRVPVVPPCRQIPATALSGAYAISRGPTSAPRLARTSAGYPKPSLAACARPVLNACTTCWWTEPVSSSFALRTA